jgi:hypothetical protein
VHKRGSEVNYLYLIEVLVLLEEDVLGFEISMHNLVLMAVVNAGKNLLYKNCSIFFGKLSSCDNLVKKLSAFADP